jgi:hypothetical protein
LNVSPIRDLDVINVPIEDELKRFSNLTSMSNSPRRNQILLDSISKDKIHLFERPERIPESMRHFKVFLDKFYYNQYEN